VDVKLKKNGWHYHLQVFVIGDHAERRFNLCPYFWITVFCLITSPIVAVVKLFYFILNEAFERVTAFLDEYFCKPLDSFFTAHASSKVLKNMWKYSKEKDDEDRQRHKKVSKDSIYTGWRWYGSDGSIKLGDKFSLWKKAQEAAGKDWRKEVSLRLKREEEEREVREKEDWLRRQENTRLAAIRKKKIDKIMMTVAKWVFMPTMALAGGTLILFVLWLLWRAYVVFNWSVIGMFILKGLMYSLVVLACSAAVGFPIYLLVYLVNKCDIHISFGWMKPLGKPFIAFGKWITPFFRKINSFLYACAEGMGSFFSFFWEYAKGWKENHCPAITWED